MRTPIVLVAVAALSWGALSVAGEVVWTPANDMVPQGVSIAVAAGDLDQDMDQDLSFIAGNSHYWNIGTPQSPVWELDLTQYLDIPFCHFRTGTLGDVDGDDDLDLVVGCMDSYESLRMYRNVGSPEFPAWEHDLSAFEDYPNNEWPIDPYLVDMDADGDLDICIATSEGQLSYLENMGTPTVPEWTYTGWIEGIQIGPGALGHAALGDIDGDGDPDLVGITSDTPLQCWENTGTPEVFEFVENPDMVPGEGVSPETGKDVELVDIDADGDTDLLVISVFDGNYLFLNEGLVSVESTRWGVIKAMFRQ